MQAIRTAKTVLCGDQLYHFLLIADSLVKAFWGRYAIAKSWVYSDFKGGVFPFIELLKKLNCFSHSYSGTYTIAQKYFHMCTAECNIVFEKFPITSNTSMVEWLVEDLFRGLISTPKWLINLHHNALENPKKKIVYGSRSSAIFHHYLTLLLI